MPIETLLTHRVSRIRRIGVLDDEGQPTTDEYGQPLSVEDAEPGIAVAIQPKTAREAAAFHQAGAAISTHTIYAVDRTILAADAIYHDPDACPVVKDLPRGRYELSGVPDAAGLGHHLEIDATLVSLPEPAATPGSGGGGSGSGS
jgi:hypothetical protein